MFTESCMYMYTSNTSEEKSKLNISAEFTTIAIQRTLTGTHQGMPNAIPNTNNNNGTHHN